MLILGYEFSDIQVKVLLTDMLTIEDWLQSIINVRVTKLDMASIQDIIIAKYLYLLDDIIRQNNGQPDELTLSEKEVIIEGLTLETGAEKNARMEAQMHGG